jgi:hypothetical protein
MLADLIGARDEAMPEQKRARDFGDLLISFPTFLIAWTSVRTSVALRFTITITIRALKLNARPACKRIRVRERDPERVPIKSTMSVAASGPAGPSPNEGLTNSRVGQRNFPANQPNEASLPRNA